MKKFMPRELFKPFGTVWFLPLVAFWGCSLVRADSILNFPRLSFEQSTLTGVAIVNPSSQDAVVTITAYGTDGTLLSGGSFTNPNVVTVKANQQLARLATELFGGTLSSATVGWFQATSSVDGLTGFFLFLNSSFTVFDGADLPAAATSVIFNEVRLDFPFTTELNIVNPGASAANLTLALAGAASPVSKPLVIPGKGVARLDVANFFGVTTVFPGAYVSVSSDAEIAGFEFVKNSSGDLLGLNARSASEQLTNLYFPQLAVLGPWKTEVGLVNYSSSPAILTISAYKGDGTLYGAGNLQNNPVTRALNPGAGLREDVETMFGFNGASTLDGWIKVESTAAAINGYVTYGMPLVASVAAVASAPRGLTRALFSHIATTAGFYTGVALLNPGAIAANVRLLAVRPDGQVLGSLDIVLQPGQRISRLINELIRQADNQGGGLIWVKSDQPIYSTSLFGSASVLANIPAQTAPDSYQPDVSLPTLKLNPALAVLQAGTNQNFQVQGATGIFVWKTNGVEGGNSTVGVISPVGVFQAPARVPSPQVVTVTAQSGNQIAGASVDVIEKTSLVTNLGFVQSVAYLASLKKLYDAELATISSAKPLVRAAFATIQNSTVFEVSPATKNSVAGFNSEKITKMISFGASDGKEYLLLAANISGRVIGLNPTTKRSQDVATGLNQPTALVIDPLTGNVLVAEADRISILAKATVEAAVAATKGSLDASEQKAVTIFQAAGSAGIAVDHCNGNIYVSDSIGGRIIEYARANGQIQMVASNVGNPGQLLSLYRSGVSCPSSFHLLVLERGLNRISLVVPKDKSVTPWLPAPGATDLALLPRDNPLTGSDGVLFTQSIGTVAQVTAAAVPDIYRAQPINPPIRNCPSAGSLIQNPFFRVTSISPQSGIRGQQKLRAFIVGTTDLARYTPFLKGGVPVPQSAEEPLCDISVSFSGGGIRAQPLNLTLAQRNGDFTGSPPILDPSTGLPFPGNRIPTNKIGSVMVLPVLLTIDTNTKTGNYTFVVTGPYGDPVASGNVFLSVQ